MSGQSKNDVSGNTWNHAKGELEAEPGAELMCELLVDKDIGCWGNKEKKGKRQLMPITKFADVQH